jgi:stage II sporulation protein D
MLRPKNRPLVLRYLGFLTVCGILVWQAGTRNHGPLMAMTLSTFRAAGPRLTKPIEWVRPPMPVAAFKAAPRPEVRIRLFSDQKIRFISVSAENRLKLNDKPVASPVRLSLEKGQLVARSRSRIVFRGARATLRPEQGEFLLQAPAGKRQTAGLVRVTAYKGVLQIVNVLERETYLLGIVEPELGSLKLPPAVVEAQLIASRSWILAMQDHHPKDSYNFCDSAHCQVYAGLKSYPAGYWRAVRSVQGRYLTYKGRPAAAFFHHSCGGSTSAYTDIWPGSPKPYLKRVKDVPHKTYVGVSEEWSITLGRAAMVRFLRKQRWLGAYEPLTHLQVVRSDPAGRAQQVRILGVPGRWIQAQKFRNALNAYFKTELLRSTVYQIESDGGQFRFNGRGWGHGVGLCQSGAVQMARRGKTYQQILEHYFPGVDIRR